MLVPPVGAFGRFGDGSGGALSDLVSASLSHKRIILAAVISGGIVVGSVAPPSESRGPGSCGEDLGLLS